LYREGLLNESTAVSDRITPGLLDRYTAHLKSYLAPMSLAAAVGGLASAANALAPCSDWSFLSRRSSRLRLRAKPSRDKRHAIRHTLDLYNYGKELMDTADPGKSGTSSAAYCYQAGLVIALLAARPLRIRNFQAITIGKSLHWDGTHYWLTFDIDETKTHRPINEPLPDDLRPYLERFLQIWRPLLLKRAHRLGGCDTASRRLWINLAGPMKESSLRAMIKRYTQRKFGTEIWPHLFRDCLLTSVAVDQPELVRVSASLLGHANPRTGGKHYNQARMLDASRRYGDTISELRESFFDPQLEKPQGSKD
jgi:integrase